MPPVRTTADFISLLPWEEGCLRCPTLNGLELPSAGDMRSTRALMFSEVPWGLSRIEGMLLTFVIGIVKQLVLLLQKLFWFSVVLLSQEGEREIQGSRPGSAHNQRTHQALLLGQIHFWFLSPGKPPGSKHLSQSQWAGTL